MTPEQTEVLRWLADHGFRVTRFDPRTGECVLDLGALTRDGSTGTER